MMMKCSDIVVLVILAILDFAFFLVDINFGNEILLIGISSLIACLFVMFNMHEQFINMRFYSVIGLIVVISTLFSTIFMVIKIIETEDNLFTTNLGQITIGKIFVVITTLIVFFFGLYKRGQYENEIIDYFA
jgi:putative copper export protein